MSKSNVTSKTISTLLLRKAQSSPSMTMPGESEIALAALQQQLAVIRGDAMPEGWICVARRKKINIAVGRIIHFSKKESAVSKDSQV